MSGRPCEFRRHQSRPRNCGTKTLENPRLQSEERLFMLTLHIFPVLTFVWFAPLHEST